MSKKKRNSVSRNESRQNFYEGIKRLRADIKAGRTTADTFKVENYFNSNYGRQDLMLLLETDYEPDYKLCALYMTIMNRMRNINRRRRTPKCETIIQGTMLHFAPDEQTCIEYLKSLGYKILKPKTEYEEI
jgi:hypothetical protein